MAVTITVLCIIIGLGYFIDKVNPTIHLSDKTSTQSLANPVSSAKKEVAQITLSFVGDILPARAIELSMRKNGYGYPFEKIKDELARADITFANLESPLIGTKINGKTTPGGTTVFRGDIEFAQALKNAGIDIVSLANNHMKDQGQKGIESTLSILDSVGLKHSGAGLNNTQAEALSVIEVQKGSEMVKVGYISFNDSDVVPESYHATEKQSGTNIMDVEKVKRLVSEYRPQVDILIVSMHSGTEYTKKINERQRAFARTAIDAGADMVIGHHPHVLQPIELYNGKYIYYSLGNFIFDQPWPDTRQSALLSVDVFLEKNKENSWQLVGTRPQITPLQIYQFQPQKLNPETPEYRAVLDRFDFPYKLLKLGGHVVQVKLATTTSDRERGLSGTAKLAKGQAMLFVFDEVDRHGIWMKEMNYPIDIYWFDQDFMLVDKAISVDPATYPDVFYPRQGARYVLETNVGELDGLSLTEGLTGELTDID